MTGHLSNIGYHYLGNTQYRFFRCNDCQTLYPEIDGRIRCNQRAIEVCPFCSLQTRTEPINVTHYELPEPEPERKPEPLCDWEALLAALLWCVCCVVGWLVAQIVYYMITERFAST